jgi:hypothetical protein
MKEKIKNQVEKLTKDRIALDAEIQGARQFLNIAVPEMNGLNRAIDELNNLLKEDEKPEPADTTEADTNQNNVKK